jgi:diguanylate cyclase (GGDEF)-like protein
VTVPLGQWLTGGAPLDTASVGRFAMVCVAGVLASLVLAGRAASPRAEQGGGEERRRGAAPEPVEGDDEALERFLEVARRATDAHEAALWRMNPSGQTAMLVSWIAPPDVPVPPQVVDLEGHPFAWAIVEQVHVHLQRGKRELPSPWAQEMLLVPVDGPDAVLAFAFPGVTPPGSEHVALGAGRCISTLLALLRMRREKDRDERSMQSLVEAVRTLPGEIEVERFSARLAEAVCDVTGASGAAVALAPADGQPGRVVRVSTVDGMDPILPPTVGEADSRLALAMKHGVTLTYRDLRREREKLPLFGPRERWEVTPRSAAFLPLVAEDRTIGAVVAWHHEPNRFGEHEAELLRLLSTVAPLPLRSAQRVEQLDRRASTDALTKLPNRAAFESRLAHAANYYDRYNRPFSLVMLDVDHFKKFNDTWGHEAGDRVLQHVAEILRNTVRDVDLAARLGGEEFVVLLPETGLRPAVEAAERLRRALEVRPVVWNGRPLNITASFGVAACPDCVAAPGEVLAASDAALYRSKGAGRNRVSSAPRAAGTPEPRP